jgi:hypothetical protein
LRLDKKALERIIMGRRSQGKRREIRPQSPLL